MKQLTKIVILLIVVVAALTGCKKKDIGTREQLIGRWQSGQEYMVFYDDNAGDGYTWGKEWNEGEGTVESDLDGEDYQGNGWFRWKKGSDYITIVAQLSISEAEAAVDCEISVLTDDALTFYNARRKQTKSFTKIH